MKKFVATNQASKFLLQIPIQYFSEVEDDEEEEEEEEEQPVKKKTKKTKESEEMPAWAKTFLEKLNPTEQTNPVKVPVPEIPKEEEEEETEQQPSKLQTFLSRLW